MTTLLERLTGTGDARLGEWERDPNFANARAKLAELDAHRSQLVEALQEARALMDVSADTQRRTAAAVLVGDGDSKTAKTAERDALGAVDRVRKLEADLAATELAIATVSGRMADYEHAARVAHVQQVVRPWLDPLAAELVPLLKRVAELNTQIHIGIRKVEAGFPTDIYAPNPERFKPVNHYIADGERPILDVSLKGLLIAEEGSQYSTVFSDWLKRVRAAGYDQ